MPATTATLTMADVHIDPAAPAKRQKSLVYKRIDELVKEPERLSDVWNLYVEDIKRPMCELHKNYPAYYCINNCTDPRLIRFVELVNRRNVDDTCVICVKCKTPHWQDDTQTDSSGHIVCNSCYQDVSTCSHCDSWDIFNEPNWVMETRLCEGCVESLAFWCEDCGGYYWNDDLSEHAHGSCDCSPMALKFQVPASKYGTLEQDTRLFVELPTGFINDEAIYEATRYLWYHQFAGLHVEGRDPRHSYENLTRVVNSLERIWQAKRGNFTRRLSAAIYKEMDVTLNSGLLSEVGSIVRRHSPNVNSWHIEFTRDFNQSASAFYHEDSCWWGGEGQSLCALKHWGGLAMRSYANEDISSCRPSGRVWVQPLNENLQPTQETLNAHAYIVYNGYGNLEEYTPARIVAFLTSKTYRKVDLSISHQYINCGGFLVADQEVCDANQTIRIHDLHYHTKVAA